MKKINELLLKIGIAPVEIRLKRGKMLWRQYELFLPLAVGNKKDDHNRLQLFEKMIKQEKRYVRKCLEEWLLTEINWSIFSGEENKNDTIYREHLDLMNGMSFKRNKSVV